MRRFIMAASLGLALVIGATTVAPAGERVSGEKEITACGGGGWGGRRGGGGGWGGGGCWNGGGGNGGGGCWNGGGNSGYYCR